MTEQYDMRIPLSWFQITQVIEKLKQGNSRGCCLANDAVAVDVVHPEGPRELLVLRAVEQRGQRHQHILKQKLFYVVIMYMLFIWPGT